MTRRADQDRFLKLLEEHKNILYKVSNAYCGNREDRSDLIQDIVVQLWQSFGRYDEGRRFSTWMYRIAMNVAISYHRRRSPGALSLEEFGIDFATADRVLEESRAEIQLLHRLIGELAALDKALILLYLEGYGHDEIAEIMGITATNAATRISRIKQRLTAQFGPQETNE